MPKQSEGRRDRFAGYSSYWEGFGRTSKTIKELEVTRDLISAMESKGDSRFNSPAPGPDPERAPDCVARNSDGDLVALEVTELVSEKAVAHNQQERELDNMVYWDPSPSEISAAIATRLGKKDAATYVGGPYAETVAIIHTDEFIIDMKCLEAVLENAVFGPFRNLTDAYVLISPRPHEKVCEYFRLPLRLRGGDLDESTAESQ